MVIAGSGRLRRTSRLTRPIDEPAGANSSSAYIAPVSPNFSPFGVSRSSKMHVV